MIGSVRLLLAVRDSKSESSAFIYLESRSSLLHDFAV